MSRYCVNLNSGFKIFYDVSDDHPRLADLSKSDFQDTDNYLLNELQRKYGPKKIQSLGNNYSYPNEQTVESEVMRIRRNPNFFVTEFPNALKKIIDDLSSIQPEDNLLFLEVGYSDAPNFAKENAYSDYIYIFARVIFQKP